MAQYVKDLSFENPNAPDSLAGGKDGPQMNASVNVQAKQRNQNEFECDLKIDVSAKSGEDVVFIAELIYSGIFQLTNIPQEQVQQIVFIECPRQLFPFARRVIADATRDGGFPPLLLDPIDFCRPLSAAGGGSAASATRGRPVIRIACGVSVLLRRHPASVITELACNKVLVRGIFFWCPMQVTTGVVWDRA